MKQILFVDDEPHVLQGLQNLLRRHRHKWTMVFACGADAALKELEQRPFDVVVSDMRMPGTDGAALLGQVKNLHPETVRIVLSGQAEPDTALRVVPVAHQFLAKPCDADVVENVIERACKLREVIGDQTLRRLVGEVQRLPSAPRVYTRLTKALADAHTSVADIASILEQDMAICAKLLQLVNSAFFRTARRITRVIDAVIYLGPDTVKNLVLSVEVFQAAEGNVKLGGLCVESLQQHALQTASVASGMLVEKTRADDAFMAGMLHDIGKLVLASQCPQHLKQALDAACHDGRPLYALEERIAGVTHAEVGAYLLGIWGLPYPIVEAVANHHHPTRVQQRDFDVLAAVHLADLLVHEASPGAAPNPGLAFDPIDVSYLESLGVADQLAAWRVSTAERVRSQAPGSDA